MTAKDNSQLLDYLFDHSMIDINRGRLFDTAPADLPPTFEFDRIEGMMLGLAVGDALGNTTEGLSPEKRKALHGPIRDYLPGEYSTGEAASPSDDTQLAFRTLEQMIRDRGFVPGNVAARFCSDRIFGIGSTVREFVRNYRSGEREWYRCGPKSAGNGALMRIAPMVIPHVEHGSAGLWVDTALSAMITHNDSASISACMAFIDMIRRLLAMDSPPAPSWWLETYVAASRALESDTTYRPRGGSFRAFEGTAWQFLSEVVPEAYRRDLSVEEACRLWHSGAYLLETLPSVIYILMRHGHDFEEAVVRAVNDTVDNDTIAAIVGAAAGALHGRTGIPERWIASLPGRTADKDDGKIYLLLDQAKAIWG